MTDIYEDYDLKALSSFYNGYVKSSPTAAALMERKYEQLAERIAHLSQTRAGMGWAVCGMGTALALRHFGRKDVTT